MIDLDDVLTRLAASEPCGYHRGSQQATEPAALASLALFAHGRLAPALALADWLLKLQAGNGTVGVTATETSPYWPTSLAVLTWQTAAEHAIDPLSYVAAIERALAWMLQTEGSISEHVDLVGHDTTIKGWPWVEGTHAWVEPTAMDLLALKQTGHQDHPRSKQAALLLLDRLLETGGCNYGNTIVLGQVLRPHIEPTGLALLALAGEPDTDERIARSMIYLRGELSAQTTTASLCYGLLGLAAMQSWPADADEWLSAARERTIARDASGYKLALIALAALGPSCPLVQSTPASLAR